MIYNFNSLTNNVITECNSIQLKLLRRTDKHLRKATLSEWFLAHFPKIIFFKRKEFAHKGGGEQILSFSSRSLFRRQLVHRKANWKSQKLSPLCCLLCEKVIYKKSPDVNIHSPYNTCIHLQHIHTVNATNRSLFTLRKHAYSNI